MSSLDLTALRVITLKDGDQAATRGAKEIVTRQGTVITPLALDALQRRSIALRQDDIFQFTMDRMRQTLFASIPYRFPTLGNKEAVARVTSGMLADLHRRFCVPENLVVSVCGDFDATNAEKLLRRVFSRLPRRPVPVAAVAGEWTKHPVDHEH